MRSIGVIDKNTHERMNMKRFIISMMMVGLVSSTANWTMEGPRLARRNTTARKFVLGSVLFGATAFLAYKLMSSNNWSTTPSVRGFDTRMALLAMCTCTAVLALNVVLLRMIRRRRQNGLDFRPQSGGESIQESMKKIREATAALKEAKKRSEQPVGIAGQDKGAPQGTSGVDLSPRPMTPPAPGSTYGYVD